MILGWDAAGVVERIGPAVTLFKPGDEVYYCGSIARPGCNAEYGLVDERIAALKPRSLSFTEAAALPLTAITAWESLFERLKIRIGKAATDDAILVIGAAGGVGSMATQLARRVPQLAAEDIAHPRMAGEAHCHRHIGDGPGRSDQHLPGDFQSHERDHSFRRDPQVVLNSSLQRPAAN